MVVDNWIESISRGFVITAGAAMNLFSNQNKLISQVRINQDFNIHANKEKENPNCSQSDLQNKGSFSCFHCITLTAQHLLSQHDDIDAVVFSIVTCINTDMTESPE